jgi:hypothetical protein
MIVARKIDLFAFWYLHAVNISILFYKNKAQLFSGMIILALGIVAFV